ncbi:MAG: hypothetical protein RPU35_09140 [Candidatus Sedimenticola sp. (ex Thyasira tokunagai)]
MATSTPKTLLLLVVSMILLSACDGDTNNSYRIPIHIDCEDGLKTYIAKKNDQLKLEKLNAILQLGKFDYGDVNHPYIAGYVELKGSVSEERSRLLLNAISYMCYPTSRTSMGKQELKRSALSVAEELVRIRMSGVTEVFIKYEEDNSVEMYYPAIELQNNLIQQ